MTLDELDLAFEDHERDRSRHRSRHRRSARRGRGRGRGRRGRSVLALFLTVIILGGLAGGAWYGFQRVQGFFTAPDYSSAGTGEVVVQVQPGQSAAEIAQTLYDKGVVKSTKAFVSAAQANPRSTQIQPGSYRLRQRMRASQALAMLLNDASRLVEKVTVPEGTTVKGTIAILSKATGIPPAEFEAAAKDPVALGVPDFWFTRSDGKQPIKSVEGFLFPATYSFDPGATAAQVLSVMIKKFLSVAESINLVQVAQSKSITPFEALITASLVEAEAGIPEDMGKVARVVYNRLDHSPAMPLQFDSTTNYWLSLQGQDRKPSQHLTQQELSNPSNPYNTATKLGLPPGPIGNPGQAALAAAVNPVAGTWLFFVVIDKTGKSAFATTDAEHERNKEIARKNGVL